MKVKVTKVKASKGNRAYYVPKEEKLYTIEEKGVNYFFLSDSYLHYNSALSCFRRLLEDKEYGLKTIVLLWETLMQKEAKNIIPYLGVIDALYRVFPWQKEASLNDMCEDSILTIEDWLIENYREEMMVDFLNKGGKK